LTLLIKGRETQEVDEKEVSISEKQKPDKDLTLIRKWVEKGEKPELKEITGESITALHPFANQANNTPVYFWLEFFATQDVQMFDYHDSVTV
jgi:hypothetical protein